MNNTRYLELDFYRTSYKSVKAHQYDKNTRYIIVTCINDAKIYPLNTSWYCNLKLETPDGRHMLKTQTIQSDGTVLIKLEESMLLAAGICKAELNVYDFENGTLLSTMPFDLIVIGSVYDNSVIESSDEFDALTDALETVQECIEKTEEVVEDAENAIERMETLEENVEEAEAIRVTQEIERQANEINRISAENKRVNAENIRVTNETERNNNEATREANELLRQTSETNRESAEASRKSNETDRQSGYIEMQNAINEFSKDLDAEIKRAKEAENKALSDANAYIDTKIDAIVGEGASTTLDTIGEISKAIEEHQDITDALNAAIGTKANASDLTSHVNNTTIHVTSTEKNNYNTAYTHSQSAHAPSNAEKNVIIGIQKNGTDLSVNSSTRKVNITVPTKVSELTNDAGYVTNNTNYSQATSSTLGLVKIGFSESGKNYSVKLNSSGQMYVNVPWTDTTYSAGTGISLSGTTFSNSGVRSIATGSSNGTISVNTGGTTANVSVKGLSTAAYRGVTTATAKIHTNYGTNGTYLPSMDFLSYWNGAYNSNGSSNLSYCNQGTFGSIVTKSSSDYIPTSSISIESKTTSDGTYKKYTITGGVMVNGYSNTKSVAMTTAYGAMYYANVTLNVPAMNSINSVVVVPKSMQGCYFTLTGYTVNSSGSCTIQGYCICPVSITADIVFQVLITGT